MSLASALIAELNDNDLDTLADLLSDRLALRAAAAEKGVSLADVARRSHRLVDASTVAGALGVSRRFVYEHGDDLGAVRVGAGSKPRLRFDLAVARDAMTCCAGERSEPPIPSDGGRSGGGGSRSAARLPNGLPRASEILALGQVDGRKRPRRSAS